MLVPLILGLTAAGLVTALTIWLPMRAGIRRVSGTDF